MFTCCKQIKYPSVNAFFPRFEVFLTSMYLQTVILQTCFATEIYTLFCLAGEVSKFRGLPFALLFVFYCLVKVLSIVQHFLEHHSLNNICYSYIDDFAQIM